MITKLFNQGDIIHNPITGEYCTILSVRNNSYVADSSYDNGHYYDPGYLSFKDAADFELVSSGELEIFHGLDEFYSWYHDTYNGTKNDFYKFYDRLERLNVVTTKGHNVYQINANVIDKFDKLGNYLNK